MTAAGIEELTVGHSYPTGTRLPVPVPLGMEDSFWGYLHSVARWYSYPTPMMLMRETKTHQSAMTVRAPLDPLARLLKIPVSDLERRTYWRRPDKTRRFFDVSIGGHDLSLLERRICPECLREGRAHSALFDIAVNTVCDRHNLNLLSKCPKCRRRLGWQRKGFEQCTCGFNLDRIAGDRAGPAALRYARLLRRAAGFLDASADSGALDMGTWPHDLLSLDLKTLCGVVKFFLLRDRLLAISPRRQSTLDVLLPHIERSLGRWFDNWPTGATALFERVRRRRRSKVPHDENPLSLSHSISRQEIRGLTRGQVPAFLDQARKLHLSAILDPETIDRIDWISVAATARRLGTSTHQVVDLCRDGQLLFREYWVGVKKEVRAISAHSVMVHEMKVNAVETREVRDRYGSQRTALLRLAAHYYSLTENSDSRVGEIQAAAQDEPRLFRVSPQEMKHLSDFLVSGENVVVVRTHKVGRRGDFARGSVAERIGYGPARVKTSRHGVGISLEELVRVASEFVRLRA